MAQTHYYTTTINWTGNRGEGTTGYKNYDRAHTIEVESKDIIKASSDPAFRGDAHFPLLGFLLPVSAVYPQSMLPCKSCNKIINFKQMCRLKLLFDLYQFSCKPATVNYCFKKRDNFY